MSGKDEIGHLAAHNLNLLPTMGGRAQITKYVPHLGKLLTSTEQMNRLQILQENRIMYERNKTNMKHRKDFAGGYPLRIPEYDLQQINEKYPESRLDAPKEERRLFFIKLYKNVKEYRIG